MEISPVGAPISPVQNNPITQPQSEPQPPEGDPKVTTEQANGKAKGVVGKLNEGDHFNAVADVRLRIVHADDPNLEKVDPLPELEDVPDKAYEKFLAQYRELYNASTAVTEAEEEPESEQPLVPEEEPVVEVPEPETTSIIPEIIPEEPSVLMPPETEPIITVEQIIPEVPVDTDAGILAAFEELWDAQSSEEEPETLDIVI
jgi:hypothetical protein